MNHQAFRSLAVFSIIALAFAAAFPAASEGGNAAKSLAAGSPAADKTVKKVKHQPIGLSTGMANPAALYCKKLGYEYRVSATKEGERGVCVVAPGLEFDAWDFFKGKVGKEYSYAARHGYDIKTKRVKRGSYVEEYAVCVSRGRNKEEIPLAELMKRNGDALEVAPGAGFQGKTEARIVVKPETAQATTGAAEVVGAATPDMLGSPPAGFDWRSAAGQDWVTSVKDQAACGSCWAFGAIAAVEAKLNIDYNDPTLDYDLSEQHLVSCDCPGDCNGGWHYDALAYMINPGAADESCFPYLGCKNWNYSAGTCVTEWPCNLCPDLQGGAAYISGYTHITNTANLHKQALLENGPLVVVLDANGWSSYTGGVYTCSVSSPNHAVLLVGYNDSGSYWIIKNSWGASWGESGYIRLAYSNNPILVFNETYAVDTALAPLGTIGRLEAYTVSVPTVVGGCQYFAVTTGVRCLDGTCGEVTGALMLPDSPPRSGADVWGGDCSQGPPEPFDNTFDSCGWGAGGDESVYEIDLNKTSLNFGEAIEVACTVEIKSRPCGSAYTGDRMYVYYRNSPTGTWRKLVYVPQVYSCYTYSFSFIPDDVEGEHQIRCIVGYQITESSCVSAQYYDTDDVNFFVYNNGSAAGALPSYNCQRWASFEGGYGDWTNATGDDFNWMRIAGSTPTSNTGPSAAYNGQYYVYTESSAPNYPNKAAILEGPVMDLDNGTPEMSFYYHMYGSGMGTLYLDLEDGAGGWTTLWSASGDQLNQWWHETVDLSAHTGMKKARFRMVTGASSLGDAALDVISWPGAVAGSPFYTVQPNPSDPVMMYQNDVWEQTWLVQATGAIGTSWPLHVAYQSSHDVVGGVLTAPTTITIGACPSFSGPPDEYTYNLEGSGDITVTDTVADRDGVTTVPAGTASLVFAGTSYNLIAGTAGSDTLHGVGIIEDDQMGRPNNDLILGFAGDDSLRGYNGDDVLIGGGGGDLLYGDNGNDILLGEAGNDTLYPGTGNDEADGGDDTDLVVLADPGNAGNTFDGGPGSGDKLLLASGYTAFSMTGCHGFEKFAGGNGDNTVDWSDATVNLEIRGHDGDDTFTGGSGNDILRGYNGDDALNGGDGNDSLFGDNGNDTLSGGDGTDTLYTGAGNDAADGGAGDNDRVVLADASATADTVAGGDGGGDQLILADGYGSYAMTGSAGFESFTGGNGDDSIDWSSATVAVILRGNDGDDVLTGGSGNDLITGGNGNDVMNGGAGADTLYGDGGVNHLTGGTGNDSIRGGGSDFAHFSAEPVAPGYDVRDRTSYFVVVDVATSDGTDIVRGCPAENLSGPYTP